MKLISWNVDEIGGRKLYRRSANLRILQEFANSDMTCAKVEDYTHKSAAACASSLVNSIKNYRIPGIQAVVREGAVYLIKVKD